MNQTAQFFQTNGTMVSLLVALLAAIFTGVSALFIYKAWRTSKEILKNQVFADLIKEYCSTGVGIAIRELWEFYRDKCHEKKDLLVENYVFEAKRNKTNDSNIHYRRRIVSTFYQRMAVLRTNGVLSMPIIGSFWEKGDLEIIPKVLIPIETIAIPILIKKKPARDKALPRVFQNMLNLYEEMK